MIKIILIVIIGLLLTVLLKQFRPEYAFLTRISLICVCVVSAVAGVELIIEKIGSISALSDIDIQYINIMVKAVGAAVITQTAGNICRDCGESALAVITEFTGKIVIAGFALPIILKLIELSVELLK